MNRRAFLRYAGGGVAVLAGLSSIGSCSGAKREAFSEANDTKGLKLDKDEVQILYLASLAPSGHNSQPWTVNIVEPKHWIIGTDRRRRLPAIDPANRECLLSVGAFLENLVIAAGILGYGVDVEVTAKDPKEAEIAHARLRKDKPTGYPIERIKKRRTVRSSYLGKEISADDIKYFTRHDPCPSAAPTPPSSHCFYFPKNSLQGEYLRHGIIEANRKQAFRDTAQEELSNWIRWSNSEAKQYRNGLTPESMGIGGFAGLYVRTFYSRKTVLEKGFRERGVDMASEQVNQGSGWIVVTSPDSSTSSLVAFGRVFENMLLRARERMIAIHPMSQVLEEEPWKTGVSKELNVPGEVQWILRVGYVRDYPDPVTMRMPLASFVRTTS